VAERRKDFIDKGFSLLLNIWRVITLLFFVAITVIALIFVGIIAGIIPTIPSIPSAIQCETNSIKITTNSSELDFVAIDDRGVYCGVAKRGYCPYDQKEIMEWCLGRILPQIGGG